MRIFYWSKKQLGKLMLIVFSVLILGIISYDLLKNNLTVTTLQSQPIYQGDTNYKRMALTFNVDWGEEYLPAILSALEQHDSKATFFITGRFAAKFPGLVKQIADQGHEIGNHGYSHPHPDNISKRENQREIKSTEEVLKNCCGVTTVLFAPPYGEHKQHVVESAEEIGYKTILWTIDTIDWDKSRQAKDIENKVLNSAQNGAIVLMHPTDRTVLALPAILEQLTKEGYELSTVSEALPSLLPSTKLTEDQ